MDSQLIFLLIPSKPWQSCTRLVRFIEEIYFAQDSNLTKKKSYMAQCTVWADVVTIPKNKDNGAIAKLLCNKRSPFIGRGDRSGRESCKHIYTHVKHGTIIIINFIIN